VLYLGIDSSTQGLTAIVLEIDRDSRRIVFQHTLNFDRDVPEYGTSAGVFRGDDPREVWSSPLLWADALERMVGVITGALGDEVTRIEAISGSAQQHGSVYLNRTAADVWRTLDPHRALAPQLARTFSRDRSPVWLDASTTDQCREIERLLGGAEATARLTGSRAYERFTGPQIRKFAERDPVAYAETSRVHLVSSYLASLLAGCDAPIDPGDGAGMNLMDITSLHWLPAALDATAPGLAARLPGLAPSSTNVGSLSSYWQRRYGLPAASVIAWSGDNPCSLVGTGIVDETRLAVSLGTSDTVFAFTPTPGVKASHVFGAPTGGYMSLVCCRNGSLTRERIRDEHRLDWPGFTRALAETPPGNDGAMMLPWFEPEITPHVAAAGVRRFDLDPADAARNVRAVVEAQMMAMANHADGVAEGRFQRIIATGGAATNRAILQVMADVFGVDVYPLESSNSACLGAALRAYHAERLSHGESIPWSEVVRGFTDSRDEDRVSPLSANVELYARLRRVYAQREAEALQRSS
jgi:xylulokinase